MKSALSFVEKLFSVGNVPALHSYHTAKNFIFSGNQERYIALALPALAVLMIGGGFSKATGLGFVGFAHGAVGLMLAVFALFKLIHPIKFASGFTEYDPVASRIKIYACVFPLLQLALSVAFLAFWQQGATYALTAMISLSAASGLLSASDKGGVQVRPYGTDSLLHTDAKTAAAIEYLAPAVISLILMAVASY